MKITGAQHIAASREDVWQALNTPETLKRCPPGCELVEQTDEHAFRIVITAAIGPLRPRFEGSLRLTDAMPPDACVLVFEGQGGAVGFGKGTAAVTLQDGAEGGTELDYVAQVQVGGKLAQVGARLIDSVAKKVSSDFFTALQQQFAPKPQQAAETRRPPVLPAALDSGTPPVEMSRPRVPGWWLVVAFLSGVGATLAGALII